MWYITSVFWLLFSLAAFTAVGAAFIDFCLPWRLKPAANEFLAPTFGLALLLIPITVIGWLGHGFRCWFCLLLTVGAAALAHWKRGRRGTLWQSDKRYCWRLAGFAVLASFPMLGELLQFNTFNPFNDAWTYLYQAQWLQQHGFQQPAMASDYHPAALAVLSFQRSGLRISPSLLLGWLQAMFGLDWSYKIYPTTVSLALICGTLAVGGIVRAVFPKKRREAWWVALMAAVTLNGFAFGAVSGFLPQTIGLAFSTALLALRGLELSVRLPPDPGADHLSPVWFVSKLRVALPVSVCLAGVAYCYPELLPFVVPALAISYVLPWPQNRVELRRRCVSVGWVALLTSIVVCFEASRVVEALRMQLQVVAGHPVAWSIGSFVAQALGLRSGISEGGTWFYEGGWGTFPKGIVPVACFGLLLFWVEHGRHPSVALPRRGTPRFHGWLALVPTLVMSGVCALAFLYYRYFVPNPWPQGLGPWAPGVGQSFSQLKLSLWASPALLALAGAASIQLMDRRWVYAGIPLIQWLLAAWCAVGLGWNGQLLLGRTNAIRVVSGDAGDPFGSYHAFCEPLDKLPPSDVIYLDATAGDFASIKQRELVAYFLGDRGMAGDWTVDDNLPVAYLPPAERKVSMQAADWIVRYHSANADPTAEVPPSVCRLTIARVSPEGWKLKSITGGYDREHELDGSWFYWTPRELQMVWRQATPVSNEPPAPAAPAQRVRISFDLRSYTTEQTLTVQIAGGVGGDQRFTIPIKMEKHHFESTPFVVAGNEVQVSVVGSSEPTRASATDPRKISYLVSSAMLEPVGE